MKISPISAAGAVVGSIEAGAQAPATMSQKIRSLKMTTNVTPGRIEDLPAAAELSKTDVITDEVKAVEDTQPLSPQFAALARQRRALQVREAAIADKEKAMETQSTPQADAIPMAKLTSDPIGTLLAAGVTYEQLTEAVLANQNGYNPEIQALKDEIKALKGDVQKTFADKESQAETQALDAMERDAKLLSAQGEEFELVRETGGIKHVRELIHRTYKETGEVLDVREALAAVENQLLEDNLKLANLKKLQSHFTPQAHVLQPQQQRRQPTTLTNRDTAAVPMSRKQRALAAFQGTLQK